MCVRPTADGPRRSLSTADWLVCATAAHHGLAVLHDDNDFRAAARVLTEVTERSVFAPPS
jgi:predicted nucleic acid-binding protein